MSLRFNDVPVINEVSPVFNAQSEYNNDTSPMKVDLIVGSKKTIYTYCFKNKITYTNMYYKLHNKSYVLF